MRKNTCRVIKIDKEALFEFIYENFIAQEENLLDINNSVDVSNNYIFFGPSAAPERQEIARQDMRPNRAVFVHTLPK